MVCGRYGSIEIVTENIVDECKGIFAEEANPLDIDWLQFFSGGVPALEYFRMQVDGIRELIDKSTDEAGINITAELCMIGLAAYFEAFCKNEFAAVINIFPETLSSFTERRDCRIAVKDILPVISEFHHSLGFLIAEGHDFGSAKAINGLFLDLLKITPFSKKEAAKFGEFWNDRNLLVHHGGIYTAKYKGQKLVKSKIGAEIYFDSLVIKKNDVLQWADFLITTAKSMGSAARDALSAFAAAKKLKCDSERRKAIDALAYISDSSPT